MTLCVEPNGTFSSAVFSYWAREGDVYVGSHYFGNASAERFVRVTSKLARMGLAYAYWNQQQLDAATQRLRDIEPELR